MKSRFQDKLICMIFTANSCRSVWHIPCDTWPLQHFQLIQQCSWWYFFLTHTVDRFWTKLHVHYKIGIFWVVGSVSAGLPAKLWRADCSTTFMILFWCNLLNKLWSLRIICLSKLNKLQHELFSSFRSKSHVCATTSVLYNIE